MVGHLKLHFQSLVWPWSNWRYMPPRVIELLHQLNDTGCCEFLCEPYSHGLSSLANEECFREEVDRMKKKDQTGIRTNSESVP